METVEEFLERIGTAIDIDILNNVEIDDIPTDGEDAFDYIQGCLYDNDAFNQEIIYYANAIDFLKEHDTSLMYSAELASNMGYSLDNINSEILASVLATDMCKDSFNKYESEIVKFFNNLNIEEK